MPFIRGIIVVLALLQGGWMLLDGSRALIVGEYFTFQSRAGQRGSELGPWHSVVEAVGIQPKSTLMKGIFVAYGLLEITAAVYFIRRKPWSRALMLIVALGSLWYLGIATPLTLTQIILLVLLPAKDCRPSPLA